MVDESLREAQTLGSPIYKGKHLDGEVHDAGQLHGTRGGLAVLSDVDSLYWLALWM